MTDEMIAFLKSEFNLSLQDLDNLDENKMDQLYNSLCDIEVGEAVRSGDEMSLRGKIASSLVTYIYNTYAEASI